MNKKYVKALARDGKRIDDRDLTKFRDVKVEKGVVESAEGSARVTIGGTVVLAGVKLRVMEPYPDTPNEGSLIVDVEFVPFANEKFETGPPKPGAIEIARVIDRGIRESKTIAVEKLCIKEREAVWTAHIDVHVINDCGNLLDAGALAALAALEDAKLLGYDLEAKKIIREKKGNLPLTDQPVAITVVKIVDKLILDPCLEEWDNLDARITITTTKSGEICSIQKGGEGFLTLDEVKQAVELAIEHGKVLRKLL